MTYGKGKDVDVFYERGIRTINIDYINYEVYTVDAINYGASSIKSCTIIILFSIVDMQIKARYSFGLSR